MLSLRFRRQTNPEKPTTLPALNGQQALERSFWLVLIQSSSEPVSSDTVNSDICVAIQQTANSGAPGNWQPANHTDIIDMISEIDQIFTGYRDRLASVASELVLKSASDDQLQSLFRLNSAGDLSDLANVLDDKVISFLNELFDKRSGNTGDWASPHS